MKKYKGISGNYGVTAYEILQDSIIIQFQYRDSYLYDYEKPGKSHVEKMKTLAIKGKGLTTYINQKVRGNYREKLK